MLKIMNANKQMRKGEENIYIRLIMYPYEANYEREAKFYLQCEAN